jgi:hypothetical protein
MLDIHPASIGNEIPSHVDSNDRFADIHLRWVRHLD